MGAVINKYSIVWIIKNIDFFIKLLATISLNKTHIIIYVRTLNFNSKAIIHMGDSMPNQQKWW